MQARAVTTQAIAMATTTTRTTIAALTGLLVLGVASCREEPSPPAAEPQAEPAEPQVELGPCERLHGLAAAAGLGLPLVVPGFDPCGCAAEALLKGPGASALACEQRCAENRAQRLSTSVDACMDRCNAGDMPACEAVCGLPAPPTSDEPGRWLSPFYVVGVTRELACIRMLADDGARARLLAEAYEAQRSICLEPSAGVELAEMCERVGRETDDEALAERLLRRAVELYESSCWTLKPPLSTVTGRTVSEPVVSLWARRRGRRPPPPAESCHRLALLVGEGLGIDASPSAAKTLSAHACQHGFQPACPGEADAESGQR